MKLRIVCVVVGYLSFVLSMAAQTASSSPASAQVPPPLIQFSNIATDESGNTLSGVVSMTFSLYNSQQGVEPLWTETQNNVQLDPTGHYSVQLGITKTNGVPTALFSTGQARWLGVQISGQVEQPRVLLLSVPYALKAGDAATIGGLPPSAFVLAAPVVSSGASLDAATVSSPASVGSSDVTSDVTTTGGTVNAIPLFSTATNIQNSAVTQTGTGTTAKIGIGTTTPAVTLDVKGGETVRGTLALPATGTATASAGKNSQPINWTASAFNSGTETAVNQVFRWQAEPVGNNTATTSGLLDLLYATGTATPTSTGLKIAHNGHITFASGQTFPGTGDGTVTSVGSGLGLTGGPITSSGTLKIDTTVVPRLNTANTFTGNQTVNGNLSATGVMTGSYYIGSALFAFGSYVNGSAFLGFAGNTNPNNTGTENTGTGLEALSSYTTGSYNTASGFDALVLNTAGNFNTANGYVALYANTTGTDNTASGHSALFSNTTGNDNTANGSSALYYNTTGNDNTASGYGAGYAVDGSFMSACCNTFLGANSVASTGTLTNATAIGANSDVASSNALVLGSINGVNGATASTNVGIGITAPQFTLDLHGGMLHVGGNVPQTPSVEGAYLDWNALTNTTGETDFINNQGGGIGGFAFMNTPKSGSPVSTLMFITGSGEVGIGTTAPDSLLSVNGSADKSGGGSWGTFSDARLKTLNGNFTAGLSQIMKLHPVRYRYKEQNAMNIRDRDEHIGFVAQDVQRVIPEAVTENSKGYLLVNNDPILWTMLNAIKEQQREYEQQQAVLRTQAVAIRNLKSELRATRQSLQKVKAQVAASQLTVVATK